MQQSDQERLLAHCVDLLVRSVTSQQDDNIFDTMSSTDTPQGTSKVLFYSRVLTVVKEILVMWNIL